MSVTVHNTVILETPIEAIERVLEELVLNELDYEPMLCGSDLRSHLGTLCEGYRCGYHELPGPFVVIVEATERRGETFAVGCSTFIDLLWKQRKIEAAKAA